MVPEPPAEGEGRRLVVGEVDDEDLGTRHGQLDPLRLEGEEEPVHVDGEAGGRGGVSEAAEDLVVPPSAADVRPEAGRVPLEVDPRVVVEAPHLAEVQDDVVGEPVGGQQPVDLAERQDRALGARVLDEGAGPPDRLGPAVQVGEGEEEVGRRRRDAELAHEPRQLGGVLAAERVP